jgi:hypothetical protein
VKTLLSENNQLRSQLQKSDSEKSKLKSAEQVLHLHYTEELNRRKEEWTQVMKEHEAKIQERRIGLESVKEEEVEKVLAELESRLRTERDKRELYEEAAVGEVKLEGRIPENP